MLIAASAAKWQQRQQQHSSARRDMQCFINVVQLAVDVVRYCHSIAWGDSDVDGCRGGWWRWRLDPCSKAYLLSSRASRVGVMFIFTVAPLLWQINATGQLTEWPLGPPSVGQQTVHAASCVVGCLVVVFVSDAGVNHRDCLVGYTESVLPSDLSESQYDGIGLRPLLNRIRPSGHPDGRTDGIGSQTRSDRRLLIDRPTVSGSVSVHGSL